MSLAELDPTLLYRDSLSTTSCLENVTTAARQKRPSSDGNNCPFDAHLRTRVSRRLLPGRSIWIDAVATRGFVDALAEPRGEAVTNHVVLRCESWVGPEHPPQAHLHLSRQWEEIREQLPVTLGEFIRLLGHPARRRGSPHLRDHAGEQTWPRRVPAIGFAIGTRSALRTAAGPSTDMRRCTRQD